jgi:hypothetical protein
MTGQSPRIQKIIEALDNLRRSGRFVEKGNLEWHKVGFQIDGLIGINPVEGWLGRCYWHLVMGNTPDIHYSVRNVFRLTRNVPVILETVGIYAGHGMPSAAAPAYAYAANPVHGNLPEALPYAAATGCLQMVAEYIDKASAQGTDLGEAQELAGKVQRAAKILQKHGITDANVAAHLDLAGEVMREDKRFQSLPQLHMPDDTPESFLIEFLVDCSPTEVATYNQRLSEKEKAAGIAGKPAYHVVFSAAGQER